MKTGVIVRSPLGKTKNIGDYIQSVSQEQFFDHVDYYIEREKMDEFQSDEMVKVIISDYSSCIFDAALREIPCFIFATDFEEYKGSQGTYFEMEELPFPYAKNNEELVSNIQKFNLFDYLKRWNDFKNKTGLIETGHSGKDIAQKIFRILNGEKAVWK